VKKEPEDEEGETEEAKPEVSPPLPKPKRGRKRKVPAAPEPPEVKAEVKEEELSPDSPPKVVSAPRSPEGKREAAAASSSLGPSAVALKTEIRKVDWWGQCFGSGWGFMRIHIDWAYWIWIHCNLYFLDTDPYWKYGFRSRRAKLAPKIDKILNFALEDL